MIISIDEETSVNMKQFISVGIYSTPREKYIKTGFFSKSRVEEIESYTLKFDYIGVDDRTYSITSRSDDKTILEPKAKKIIQQIKNLDNSLIDQALEDAIFNKENK